MSKMNYEHVNAISQATTACLLTCTGNCSPVFKRLMRKQATRLKEVGELIEQIVDMPDLPYIDEKLEKDIENLIAEHSHGPTAKPT